MSSISGINLENNKMKIISFANEPMKRVALNWAAHIKLLDIENYLIYALDEETYTFLREHKINTELRDNIWKPQGVRGKNFWDQRFKFVYSLLKSGEDILQSDLDAVWLRDPLGLISKDCDIVASTGNIQNLDVDEQIGTSSICMGWVYFKSNNKVFDLFEEVINYGYQISDSFHDQEIFNAVLFQDCQKEDIKILNKNIKRLYAKNLCIDLLSEDLIRRHKKNPENLYIDHVFGWGQRDKKREIVLKQHNLWLLD